jgi:hypothetical protein
MQMSTVRTSRWYRLLVGLAALLVTTGTGLVTAGATAGASATTTTQATPQFAFPVLRFDATTSTATLIIPTPPCPGGATGCEWMLYANEPALPGTPTIGSVVGTSGTLTMVMPAFCGVIQIDALIGPDWTYKTGSKHQVDTCTTPTTTTTDPTTTTTSTTTTTDPTTTTTDPTTTTTDPTTTTTGPTTSTTDPSKVAAATTLPPNGGGSGGTGGSGTGSDTAGTSTLPFTGTNVRMMLLLGFSLILLGIMLLTSMETRRRLLRRALPVDLTPVRDGVAEGARRASHWFLGQ